MNGRMPCAGSLVEHFGAANNLARWLLRNKTEAEDAVQEAYLRALRYFQNFRGEDARTWLMTIVRNCCYDRLRRPEACRWDTFDEVTHSFGDGVNPETSVLRQQQVERLRQALESLSPSHYEVLMLCEFEQTSYKDAATILDIPIGTVMSRLSRARTQLQEIVLRREAGSASEGDCRSAVGMRSYID